MGRSAFGSVYQRRRRDGSLYDGWYVRYVEAGRRVERGGFATVALAEDFLARRRVERSEARILGLTELVRVRVAAAVEEYAGWLDANRRPNTAIAAAAVLDFLVSDLGERDVLSIRQGDVARHVEAARRTRGLAPSTLRHAALVLSGFFRWSIDQGYARDNPARGVAAGLPSIDVEEPPYLSPDELAVIYAATPAPIRTQIVLMGEAGLRRNEAIYLRRSEVGPGCRSVTIAADRSKGHRARTVPLTQLAQQALRQALEAGNVPIDRGERIFRGSAGRLNVAFRAAMDRIGRKDVTPRTLRHAFGSRAMQAGVDLEVLRRLMGHVSIETTMIYACHRPGNAGELAIAQIERAAHRDAASGASP